MGSHVYVGMDNQLKWIAVDPELLKSLKGPARLECKQSVFIADKDVVLEHRLIGHTSGLNDPEPVRIPVSEILAEIEGIESLKFVSDPYYAEVIKRLGIESSLRTIIPIEQKLDVDVRVPGHGTGMGTSMLHYDLLIGIPQEVYSSAMQMHHARISAAAFRESTKRDNERREQQALRQRAMKEMEVKESAATVSQYLTAAIIAFVFVIMLGSVGYLWVKFRRDWRPRTQPSEADEETQLILLFAFLLGINALNQVAVFLLVPVTSSVIWNHFSVLSMLMITAWGLAIRSRLAWHWARIVSFVGIFISAIYSVLMLLTVFATGERLTDAKPMLLLCLAPAIVIMPVASLVALGQARTIRYFHLQCSVCGARGKAADLMFKQVKCRRCNHRWE